jgi:hypothetical protein
MHNSHCNRCKCCNGCPSYRSNYFQGEFTCFSVVIGESHFQRGGVDYNDSGRESVSEATCISNRISDRAA